MSEENFSPGKDSFGTRLLAAFLTFVRILVRLVVIILLLGVFGLLLFGIPYVYWRYVTPVVNEFKHLESAQVEQAQLNQRLMQDLEHIQQRANTLEARLDSERQAYGELDLIIDGITSTQQAQIEVSQKTQDASSRALEGIEEEISALETKIANLTVALDQFDADIRTLQDKSEDLEKRILSESAPINQLRTEIQILKAMELLTRSRLFLTQNNLGLAKEDIQSAHDLLVNLQVPENQIQVLNSIVERLNLALANLPDSPVLVAQDLEIAWQLLKSGFSSASPTNSSPTPSPTLSGSSTNPPALLETSTPSPTP